MTPPCEARADSTCSRFLSGVRRKTLSQALQYDQILVSGLVATAGIVRFGQLEDAIGQHQIRISLRSGDLIRVARGRYRLADHLFAGLPPSAGTALCAREHRDHVVSAIRAAAVHGGVISHLSAAAAYGLWVRELPDHPHITVARGRHITAARPPATIHWAPRRQLDGLTTLEDTILDCADTCPFADAVAIADSALHSGRVTIDDLVRANLRRWGTGRSRRQRVIDACDPNSESGLESLLRVLLVDRWPTLVSQHRVRAPGNPRLDLAIPELRLGIEADGFGFHSGREHYRHDLRRRAALGAAGWRLLPFSYEDILTRPEWIVECVTAAVACAVATHPRHSPEGLSGTATGPPREAA